MMGKEIKNWEKTEHKGMWLREGSTEAGPVLWKHTVITGYISQNVNPDLTVEKEDNRIHMI